MTRTRRRPPRRPSRRRKANLRPGADPGVDRARLLRRLHRQERAASASRCRCPPLARASALVADNRRMVGKLVVVTRADVRLRLRAGADLQGDLRGARHQRARRAPSCRAARRPAPRQHAGRPRAARSRSSSTPTRAARGTSSRRRRSVDVHPGRAGDGDVRVPQPPEPDDGGQAIPSYAPTQAMAHFNKLECFCFTEHMLEAGRDASSGRWCSSSTRSCRRT